MANSIDFTTLALGALVGLGCKEQLKACGRVAAVTAANLASVAATAAAQVAAETAETKSPEAAAAEATLQRIDQQINGQSGQANQNPNG